MEFVLPPELKIVTDLDFSLKDHDGNTVGHVIAKKSTGQVVITFTDFVEKTPILVDISIFGLIGINH